MRVAGCQPEIATLVISDRCLRGSAQLALPLPLLSYHAHLTIFFGLASRLYGSLLVGRLASQVVCNTLLMSLFCLSL